MKDQVTLESAEDYGRRCTSIGKERRDLTSLQAAMSHPKFKQRHHELLDELAAEYWNLKLVLERLPFMTLQIGTFSEAQELRQAVYEGGCQITPQGNGLLGRIELSKRGEYNLYRATNAELGYPKGCTKAQSVMVLESIGAKKLPQEAGPQYCHQLTDQFTDQNVGDRQLIYTDGIYFIDDIDPFMFSAERDRYGLWLCATNARPNYFYHGKYTWIYTREDSF